MLTTRAFAPRSRTARRPSGATSASAVPQPTRDQAGNGSCRPSRISPRSRVLHPTLPARPRRRRRRLNRRRGRATGRPPPRVRAWVATSHATTYPLSATSSSHRSGRAPAGLLSAVRPSAVTSVEVTSHLQSSSPVSGSWTPRRSPDLRTNARSGPKSSRVDQTCTSAFAAPSPAHGWSGRRRGGDGALAAGDVERDRRPLAPGSPQDVAVGACPRNPHGVRALACGRGWTPADPTRRRAARSARPPPLRATRRRGCSAATTPPRPPPGCVAARCWRVRVSRMTISVPVAPSRVPAARPVPGATAPIDTPAGRLRRAPDRPRTTPGPTPDAPWRATAPPTPRRSPCPARPVPRPGCAPTIRRRPRRPRACRLPRQGCRPAATPGTPSMNGDRVRPRPPCELLEGDPPELVARAPEHHDVVRHLSRPVHHQHREPTAVG